ncbi:hypothetical protein LTR37_014374 [Vermiconidia calcicola]|uniref:Uncharacterized protein n=1 Tax=Vermiconidia calcicola TaxID=1690605 RepID=A0ACC3MTP4_9PEZI|nr:hypothetical protein LTR37_014374 [Vermiconidia calcicola]
MILRPLILRHGRLALPKSHTPLGTLSKRTLATSSCRRQEQAFITPSTAGSPQIEIRNPDDPVAQDWAFYHHQKARTSTIGTSLAPHYKPHELVSNPPRPQDVTLELLMASQAHIGHATSLWHPSNAKYIFGVRGRHDPIHIISLDITAAYLRRACKIVRGVTSRGGLVLFVGTRDGQARTVVRAAELAKGCHLFTKWTPGSITNGQQILGACGKKVVDENDNPVHGFGDQLPNAAALKPDLVVCLNPLENYILLHECGLHSIPTIGIVDTDVNPTWLTYPIPANDDSLRSVQIICGVLGRAGEEGQKIRLSKARQGIVASQPSHGLEPPTEGQRERDLEAEERARLAELAFEEGLMLEAQLLSAPEPQLQHPEELAQAEEGDVTANAEARDEMDAEFDDAEDAAQYGGGAAEAGETLDRSLRPGQMDEDYDLEDELQPYERDRPLTDEELAQAPPAMRDIQDEGRADEGSEPDRR